MLKTYLAEYQPHRLFSLRKGVNVEEMVGYMMKILIFMTKKWLYFLQLYVSKNANQTFSLVGHQKTLHFKIEDLFH